MIFYIILVFGLKAKLNLSSVNPDLLSKSVTMIEYDYFNGFNVTNPIDFYIEDDNTISLSDYAHFMICYVKKRDLVYKTDLFYNNKVFKKDKKILRLFEKIRILTKKGELPVKNNLKKDKIHFLISDLTKAYKLRHNLRSEYLHNTILFLLKLHLIELENDTENMSDEAKTDLMNKAKDKFLNRFQCYKDEDLFDRIDDILKFVNYGNCLLLEDLIFTEKNTELLDLLTY